MNIPHLILQPPQGEIQSGGFFYNRKISEVSQGRIEVREVEHLARTFKTLKGHPKAVVLDSLFLDKFQDLSVKCYCLVHHLDSFEPNTRLTSFAGLITTSRFMSESLNVCHNNIFTCPPGKPDQPIGKSTSSKKNHGFRLLTVANIIPRKGILAGIDALKGIDGDWSWDLVGSLTMDKGYAEQCRRAAADYPQIQFTGSLEHEKTWSMYQQADGFLLPTRFESFGIVFQEAIHFGLPLVAPAIGAIPEITREWPGAFLYDPAGNGNLVAALRRMMACSTKSKAAHQTGFTTSWKDRASDLANFLEK